MNYDDLNDIFKRKFVITVEDDGITAFSKRKSNITKNLKDVEFEFYDGVDGRKVDKKYYDEKGSRLTYGQLGCALSHLGIYKKMVDEDIDIALVMEDDCVFNENVSNIKSYMDMLPNDWGLLYLGYLPNSLISTPNYKKLFRIDNDVVEKGFGYVCGTHCLAITKDFAKIVYDFNKDCLFPADGAFTEIIKRFNLPSYVVMPSMADQYPPPHIECTLGMVDREMIRTTGSHKIYMEKK